MCPSTPPPPHAPVLIISSEVGNIYSSFTFPHSLWHLSLMHMHCCPHGVSHLVKTTFSGIWLWRLKGWLPSINHFWKYQSLKMLVLGVCVIHIERVRLIGCVRGCGTGEEEKIHIYSWPFWHWFILLWSHFKNIVDFSLQLIKGVLLIWWCSPLVSLICNEISPCAFSVNVWKHICREGFATSVRNSTSLSAASLHIDGIQDKQNKLICNLR